VEIRGHRREVSDELRRKERDGELGADDLRRDQEQLQAITDRWTAEVDRLGKLKEQEVLEV